MLVRSGLGAPIDPEDLAELTQLVTSARAAPAAACTRPAARPSVETLWTEATLVCRCVVRRWLGCGRRFRARHLRLTHSTC